MVFVVLKLYKDLCTPATAGKLCSDRTDTALSIAAAQINARSLLIGVLSTLMHSSPALISMQP